jgi:ankyrin repeat protein
MSICTLEIALQLCSQYRITEGQKRIIELLLEAEADPNLHEKGYSALHAVTYSINNSRIVRMLIKAGALVHTKWEERGATPLYLACEGYRGRRSGMEVVKLLIDAGADVNTYAERPELNPQERTELQCWRTTSPFHAALSFRKPSIGVIKLLLDAGSNINLKHVDSGQVPLQILLDLKPGEGKRPHLGMLEMRDFSKRHIPILKLLISYGADISLISEEQQEYVKSPLEY